MRPLLAAPLALALAGAAHAVDLDLSTYAGGDRFDGARAVTTDAAGNVYVVGVTQSNDFPTTPGVFQPEYAGGGDDFDRGDAFVMKLGPGGSPLLWATYLGGKNPDEAAAVAIGPGGDVFVAGVTQSKDFPVSPGAFQPERASDYADAFVARLSPDGTGLVYGTYLGGKDPDGALALAVDGSNQATVAGYTYANDFPVTASAFQPSRRGREDAFVTRLAPGGDALVWSTYLGGKNFDLAFGLALGADGGPVVTGATDGGDFPTTAGVVQPKYADEGDAFVTRFAADGRSLAWSTYLGGKDGNPIAFDAANGVALDADENVYVVGETLARDFPATAGAFDIECGKNDNCTLPDAFAAKLAPGACSLLYATYLGGEDNDDDEARSVVVDERARAHLTGFTRDKTFPVTPDAEQAERAGGSDAFLTLLDGGASSLVYSTFLGSKDDDAASGIAGSDASRVHLAGTSTGNDFPIAGAAFQPSYEGGGGDGFVAVFAGDSVAAPALVASLDAGAPTVGSPLAATLTVRNAGDAPATSVGVSLPLATGLLFGSATPSQGSCSFASPLLDCALGDLAAGASATVALVLTPSVAGDYAPTAEVSRSGAVGPVRAAACILAEVHDLAITKLKVPASLKVPKTAKLSVEITNLGNATERISDLDTVEALIAFDVVPTSAACTAPLVVLSDKAGKKLPLELEPGKKWKVDYSADIVCGASDYVATVVLDHTAIDGIPDSNPADDTASAPIAIQP